MAEAGKYSYKYKSKYGSTNRNGHSQNIAVLQQQMSRLQTEHTGQQIMTSKLNDRIRRLQRMDFKRCEEIQHQKHQIAELQGLVRKLQKSDGMTTSHLSSDQNDEHVYECLANHTPQSGISNHEHTTNDISDIEQTIPKQQMENVGSNELVVNTRKTTEKGAPLHKKRLPPIPNKHKLPYAQNLGYVFNNSFSDCDKNGYLEDSENSSSQDDESVDTSSGGVEEPRGSDMYDDGDISNIENSTDETDEHHGTQHHDFSLQNISPPDIPRNYQHKHSSKNSKACITSEQICRSKIYRCPIQCTSIYNTSQDEPTEETRDNIGVAQEICKQQNVDGKLKTTNSRYLSVQDFESRMKLRNDKQTKSKPPYKHYSIVSPLPTDGKQQLVKNSNSEIYI